jgi:A/G-specific adenine glycosylase
MLQQTTVAAVRGRYEAFLRRFPTLSALAGASEEQVLAAWSGLGYYGRARNLRRAAKRIAAEHGGKLPRDPAELARLPGFGEYTAAAVASIAYGAPAPAADANVTRVISRLFGLRGVAGSAPHRKAVTVQLTGLLPHRRPGDFTAALMDLGQLVCTPKKPACPRCPLSRSCAARDLGPERFPMRRSKPPVRRAHLAVADARRTGRVLLVQRPGSLLARMWRHPFAEGRSPAEARRRLEAELSRLGLALVSEDPRGTAQHTMVNRRFSIRVYTAGGARPGVRERGRSERLRWFRPSDLERAAVPTLTRKVAAASGFLPR